MSISFKHAFGLHDEALALRSYRAEILAGNLANADTPKYKARDIDFHSVLENIDASTQWKGMQTTHPRHISVQPSGFRGLEPAYRVPLQPSIDGNTVDTQMEQAAFMQNAVRYQASLTLLNGRIQGLLRAIRQE